MLKRNKYFILLLMGIIFTLGCRDSLEYRLTKRLSNFREALPEEIRLKFDQGQYEEAGKMLDERIVNVKKYVDMFPTEEKKRQYIRGDYQGIDSDIKKFKIPQSVLYFNKQFYPIIDEECIQTFTGYQVIDYFKVYFKDKLDTMK